MRRLWYFIFPLMFLPSMGMGSQTSVGKIEIGDMVILPLLLAMLLAPGSNVRKSIHRAFPVILAFIAWGLISTLSVPLRFDEPLLVLYGGLEKLAKFTLYAGVGTLAASRLNTADNRRMWLWSLLASAWVLSVGVLRGAALAAGTDHVGLSMNTEAYKAYNAIVVGIGLLFVYLAAMLLEGHGSKAWRQCALLTSGLLLLAIVGSASRQLHGRSGWFGLFFGLLYLLYRHGIRLRAVLLISLFVVGTTVAYYQLPRFQSLFDETFSSEQGGGNGVGFDDSGHLANTAHELPKVVNNPLLGTGFYHRGGSSGLWPNGPHNFLVAILLENGVIGLALMMAIFVCFWIAAGTPIARFFHMDVPSRAVVVAAFVACNAGEYFYGGTTLLIFTSLLALGTSLPADVAFMMEEGTGIPEGAVLEEAPAQ